MAYGYVISAKMVTSEGLLMQLLNHQLIDEKDGYPEKKLEQYLLDRCLGFVTAIDGGQGTNYDVCLYHFGET